jgi:hypothetical protein
MKKELLPRAGDVKDRLPSPQRETRVLKPPLTKFPSLRTQEAIARFGKAARHPLCLAWLWLREREEMLRVVMKGTEEACRLLDSAKRLKEKFVALYRQCKEGKEKQAIRAAELLCKSKELLQEVEARYRAVGGKNGLVALRNQLKEFHRNDELAFAIEQSWAEKTRDTKALRGLQYLKKTANRGMNNDRKRVFGILKMLRDKVFTGTAAKDGGAKAYWVAGSCGYWPLSDESWQGRFTVMDFRSGLEDMYGPRVAGDKQGKEVRRTLKGLGIRPAKDQRGRKWKGPCSEKQKPKRPVGRPRKAELICADNIDYVQSYKARKENWWWRPTAEFRRKQAAIERELAKLRRDQNKLIKNEKRAA